MKVLGLSLTKADGTQVQTLPAERTPADFAQLTDLTDFLSAATVPEGVYTGATLSVDFTGADIEVEVNGQAVPATVVGADGKPLGQVELPIQLDDSCVLRVVPGVPALLTLDFNLQATNTVDTSQSPPVVTVEPLMVAEVNLQAPKQHRVRGPRVSVDTATASFALAIRPCRPAKHTFGPLQVATDASTVFDVDGQSERQRRGGLRPAGGQNRRRGSGGGGDARSAEPRLPGQRGLRGEQRRRRHPKRALRGRRRPPEGPAHRARRHPRSGVRQRITALGSYGAGQAVALLAVRWQPAVSDALSVDGTHATLTLNIAGAPLLHRVSQLGISTQLQADPAPRIVPAAGGCLYALRSGGKTVINGNFADFASDLDSAQAAGQPVAFVSAQGSFDPTSQTLTAQRIVVMGMSGMMQ